MSTKPKRRLVAVGGLVAAIAVIVGHGRRATPWHRADSGVFVPSPAFYDHVSRLLLGSLFDGIADDIDHTTPSSARILEVGCGPGHLAIRLARHGFTVTAVDLDPAMITRAHLNSSRIGEPGYPPLAFQVGDVAKLPFPDATFDVVVSTLSMHHWDDPSAGLAEIERVLQPDGRVVIWDFRPGILHSRAPEPGEHIQDTRLEVIGSSPWHWPWMFNPLQRTELGVEAAERDLSSES